MPTQAIPDTAQKRDTAKQDTEKQNTEKQEIYRRLLQEAEAVFEGLDDPITLLSTAVAMVHHNLPYASWTGFYRVVAPDLLRAGPYQGPVACLEIPFGRGVCGTTAAERRSHVVPDVHAFPGHIVCDAAARSEVVVPVDDARGRLYAVLDVDSHQPAAFDEVDREGLEALAAKLAGRLTTARS